MPTRKPTPKRTKTRSRSNVAPAGTLKASWRKLSGIQLTAVVALVVGLGVFVVWSVFAGTIINNEPESFTASSSAGIATRNDPTAANGQYLEFLAPSAPSTPPSGGSGAIIPANAPVCSGRDANGDVPAGQWPGPACTGVKPGTQLTTIDVGGGNYDVNTSGVLENKLIKGCVNVNANNVTIRNSKVLGCGRFQGVINNMGVTGLLVEDVEIDGQNNNFGSVGIAYGYYTARRLNIYNIGNGLQMGDGEAVAEKNYINATYGGIFEGALSHNNGIVANGGSNMRISQNNITCKIIVGNASACSAALSLYGDGSQIKNVKVDNNLFNSTAVYCTNAGSVDGKRFPVASNVVYTNNRFGRSINPNCGTGGPVAAWSSANGNVWSGNVWNDTGSLVTP